MKFYDLPLAGAYIIEIEKKGDERGFFSRIYCRKEFNDLGLDTDIVQINDSFSKTRGTLRGIHYQLPPKTETKIVRCTTGALWDVIVDLRKNSPTFCKWHGETLTANNRKMMYVPKGFGHAFVSLEDNTELIYFVTEFYAPEYERTIRWDDPRFSIKWPFEPVIISDKDNNAPDFIEEYHLEAGRLK